MQVVTMLTTLTTEAIVEFNRQRGRPSRRRWQRPRLEAIERERLERQVSSLNLSTKCLNSQDKAKPRQSGSAFGLGSVAPRNSQKVWEANEKWRRDCQETC